VSIIILHDGIADTIRMMGALDGILGEGTRKGFRFVTVGELLAACRREGLHRDGAPRP
jgi:hypothetical protein